MTDYVALPFVSSDEGVAPGEAVECLSANAAVMRAEPSRASRAGEFGETKVIRKFGDVPDDLSTL